MNKKTFILSIFKKILISFFVIQKMDIYLN